MRFMKILLFANVLFEKLDGKFLFTDFIGKRMKIVSSKKNC